MVFLCVMCSIFILNNNALQWVEVVLCVELIIDLINGVNSNFT